MVLSLSFKSLIRCGLHIIYIQFIHFYILLIHLKTCTLNIFSLCANDITIELCVSVLNCAAGLNHIKWSRFMGKNSLAHLFSLCLWNNNFPTTRPQPALYTQRDCTAAGCANLTPALLQWGLINLTSYLHDKMSYFTGEKVHSVRRNLLYLKVEMNCLLIAWFRMRLKTFH